LVCPLYECINVIDIVGYERERVNIHLVPVSDSELDPLTAIYSSHIIDSRFPTV